MVDANDGEVVRKFSGSHEIIQRWHDKTLGEIAPSTKNRHRGGRKHAGGKTLCHSCYGVCVKRDHADCVLANSWRVVGNASLATASPKAIVVGSVNIGEYRTSSK